MNLLKSMFISSYMMLLIGVTGFTGWMLYRSEYPAAWIGVMLTTAPLLVVVTWLMMIKNVARTSAHFPLVNGLGAMGVGLALWSWYSQGASITVPILAVGAWFCFVLYAYWFSTFGGRKSNAKLQVGAVLPHFTLKHADGKSVTTEQLIGKPTILMFYRGNWCPMCMAQIKELAARYRDLSGLGVRVALISPQPHNNTVELAKKYEVNFDFLTDIGNAAAHALGIENVNGTPIGMQMFGYDNDTVLPTVIITGRDGKVVWAHETDNYRIRPEPDIYLDVLRRHQLVPAQA